MSIEMREPTFVILTALADGPRHGYAIITEAADLSGGTVTLQPGTLYAALDRLRVSELVEVAGEEIVNGRLRRSFALTAKGLGVLSEEAERRRVTAERALSRIRVATARGVTA